MSINDKHINFTAADIERYHKGQMTPAERHSLEKAALEDPFLADALEGYAIGGVDVNADIAELENRLANRVQQAKVIPIGPVKKRSSSPLLKVAAMIVAVVGAGLMVYQFAFNKKQADIAQATQPKADSAAPATSNTVTLKKQVPDTVVPDVSSNVNTLTRQTNTEVDNKANKKNEPANELREEETLVATPATPVTSDLAELKKEHRTLNNEPAKFDNASAKQPDTVSGLAMKENEMPGHKAKAMASSPASALPKSNVFKGRITDASNNPLPFANVTNTIDNVGTYSDAKGYFILTSPDSVLDVQIRSLGFANSNIRLHPSAAPNQVILQDDRGGLSEIVVSNKKINSSRSRDAYMRLEEPEPADGWTNYDTYLANNLNVPETYKGKQNSGGEVELSFEVNQNGEPVNIKIVKSLCETCDKEAIRLVKEGPKWKRKSKNGRTSVTITF